MPASQETFIMSWMGRDTLNAAKVLITIAALLTPAQRLALRDKIVNDTKAYYARQREQFDDREADGFNV